MRGPNQPCECGSGIKQKKCHPSGVPIGEPAPNPKAEKVHFRTNLLEAAALLSVIDPRTLRFGRL